MNPAVWYCTASRYKCLSANSAHNAICFLFNSTAKLFSNTILITPRHSILLLNAQVAYILARVPLANNSFFQAGLCSKLICIFSMFKLYWKSRQLK